MLPTRLAFQAPLASVCGPEQLQPPLAELVPNDTWKVPVNVQLTPSLPLNVPVNLVDPSPAIDPLPLIGTVTVTAPLSALNATGPPPPPV